MLLTELNLKSKIKSNKWKLGKSIHLNGRVTVNDVKIGYSEQSEEPMYEVHTTVKGKGDKVYNVQFLVFDSNMHHARCNCPESRRYYYGYWENDNDCEHIAAAGLAFIDYSEKNQIEIYTSKSINNMIMSYMDQQITATIVDHYTEKVDLEPKLEYKNGRLCVSFRIGSKKKYVVKDLMEFTNNMLENTTKSYGKDLELLHNINSFTEDSQTLANFIINRSQEYRLIIRENFGDDYNGRFSDKRSILLSPHNLDLIFDLLHGREVNYQGRGLKEVKNKVTKIHFAEANPKLTLYITKLEVGSKDTKELKGIKIELEDAEIYYGENYLYIRKGETLYRTDGIYKKAMESFLRYMNRSNTNELKVGIEYIGRFYQQVLSKVNEYLDVIEENGIDLEPLLPPEPEFIFYLDYLNNKNITCIVQVRYGTKIVEPHKEQEADIRDMAKEIEVMYQVRSYFPYFDNKNDFYHCNGEEETMFTILEEGVKELLALGEVNISDQLKRLQIQPSPKVSVGVSIESGIIDMIISSDNFNMEDLNEVLDSYRLRKKYHRLKNGDFLRIEDNSLETLTELIDGMQMSVKEFTKGKMQLPAYRALYLDKVLQENEGISYERDHQFKNIIRNFKSIEESDFIVPKEIKNILRNYQKYGYRWLRTLEEYGFGGILADDMGLGKTIQVITLILSAYQEGKTGQSIIITPASLVYNWQSEFHRFAPSIKVQTITGTVEERKSMLQSMDDNDVIITSYDLLKRDIEFYDTKNFMYEIIDEAQYIKNPDAQNSKAVKVLNAKVKYALTGTPIENRLSELWSIFDFLMPGYLYRYDRFKREIETPITKENDEIATARLKKLVQPFILRRLKKDVLKDLPDKLEQITHTKFEKEQSELYKAYAAKVKQKLTSVSDEEFQKSKLKILSELTRLRQICCDPSLCYDDYRGESAKLNTCMELIHDAIEGGHKILLFSQFTSMLQIIEQKLVQDKISFYVITGSTPKEKRLQYVQKFNQDSTPIFLISLKAGGTGLNLTGADVVIHYDPWWNVAAQNQATDRAHRIGQNNTVTVFRLIAKDTIEEKILELQEAKKNLADQIINGEENQLTTMSKEDFLQLL